MSSGIWLPLAIWKQANYPSIISSIRNLEFSERRSQGGIILHCAITASIPTSLLFHSLRRTDRPSKCKHWGLCAEDCSLSSWSNRGSSTWELRVIAKGGCRIGLLFTTCAKEKAVSVPYAFLFTKDASIRLEFTLFGARKTLPILWRREPEGEVDYYFIMTDDEEDAIM